MPPAAPSTLRTTARVGARALAPFVTALALLGLLGSCTGERPSIGATAATSTTVAAKTPTTATTTTTVPPKEVLGPDDLLGYIATPSGPPVVRAEAKDDSLPLDIPAETEAGAPTTFAVVGDPAKSPTPGWIRVVLPTRPNGATAWVPATSVTITKTDLRVFVDLAGRTLKVERGTSEAMTAKIAIGDTVNPTPVGVAYVTELIDNNEPEGAYGPYAFGLAMHSDTLSEFGGGDGQVGIHGTNQPSLIGQAVSHGCVRLANADVEHLVQLSLPLGVPVFIS